MIAQPGVQEAVHEDLYHFASPYWQHSQPLHPSKNDVAQSEPFNRVKGDISHCGRWCSCLEFCFQVAAFQWPLCEREKFLRQAWQLCFEHLCCSCHTMITVQADGRPGIGGFMQIYASPNLKIQSEGQEGLAVRKTKFLPRRMKLCRKLRAFEAGRQKLQKMKPKGELRRIFPPCSGSFAKMVLKVLCSSHHAHKYVPPSSIWRQRDLNSTERPDGPTTQECLRTGLIC